MNKTNSPQGFTLSMAVMDCLPVLFFSIGFAVLATRFNSHLFRLGIFLVILVGALKAGWKFVIALCHKDLNVLNKQMRFLMPIGFVLMLVAMVIDRNKWSWNAMINHITRMPANLFFLGGIIGIIALIWFAKHQDGRDAKVNWKEQAINSFTQLCIMLGILF